MLLTEEKTEVLRGDVTCSGSNAAGMESNQVECRINRLRT